MEPPVLAVLVELPLSVSFEMFIATFETQIQHVVTQQEGFVGLKKGQCLLRDGQPQN